MFTTTMLRVWTFNFAYTYSLTLKGI